MFVGSSQTNSPHAPYIWSDQIKTAKCSRLPFFLYYIHYIQKNSVKNHTQNPDCPDEIKTAKDYSYYQLHI